MKSFEQTIWDTYGTYSVTAAQLLTIWNTFRKQLSQPAPASQGGISLSGVNGQVISGRTISSDGKNPNIFLQNCQNITLDGLVLNGVVGVINVELLNCQNIIIQNCTFNGGSTGVYAEGCAAVSVSHCNFNNMQGPYPRGAGVQFNGCTGGYVGYCNVINQAGSNPEDCINCYKSNGTQASPIVIEHNYIECPGAISPHGGGIMLGDNGGSWQIARGNTLVNPGQYGVAISGGDHITLDSNTVLSDGSVAVANVGLYVWAQNGDSAGVRITNATVQNNRVLWKCKQFGQNDAWLAQGEQIPLGWSDNTWGAALDATKIRSMKN